MENSAAFGEDMQLMLRTEMFSCVKIKLCACLSLNFITLTKGLLVSHPQI